MNKTDTIQFIKTTLQNKQIKFFQTDDEHLTFYFANLKNKKVTLNLPITEKEINEILDLFNEEYFCTICMSNDLKYCSLNKNGVNVQLNVCKVCPKTVCFDCLCKCLKQSHGIFNCPYCRTTNGKRLETYEVERLLHQYKTYVNSAIFNSRN